MKRIKVGEVPWVSLQCSKICSHDFSLWLGLRIKGIGSESSGDGVSKHQFRVDEGSRRLRCWEERTAAVASTNVTWAGRSRRVQEEFPIPASAIGKAGIWIGPEREEVTSREKQSWDREAWLTRTLEDCLVSETRSSEGVRHEQDVCPDDEKLLICWPNFKHSWTFSFNKSLQSTH